MRIDASSVIPKPAREESPGRYSIALLVGLPAVHYFEERLTKNLAGGWLPHGGPTCALPAGRSFTSVSV